MMMGPDKDRVESKDREAGEEDNVEADEVEEDEELEVEGSISRHNVPA